MNSEPISPPTTMRDIGRALGIAQSTVSRALRNDPRISGQVRTRVAAKAEELNYRPNPFVSAFTSQVRTHRRSPIRPNIAFLDCHPRGFPSYLGGYVTGAQDRAATLGFGVDTICLSEIGGSLETLNRILRARGIIGLLVLPVPDGTDLSDIRYDHLAAATVDPSLRKPDLHRATPDYFQSMELTLDTLAARGRKRISYCTYPEEISRIGYRWLGSYFRWQMNSAEKVNPYVLKDWTPGPFLEYLEREKPDAVVSNSDQFHRYMRESGFKVPEDVAFASLSCGRDHPEYGGVDQNGSLVAAAAIDLIVSQIYRNEFGLPEHPKSVSIRSQWVEGRTVPAPPNRRPQPA